MKRPRIGVTPCSRLDDYVESVRRAGGEPVVLRGDDAADDVIGTLDGLLLTGGLDVDPALYGETPHPTTQAAPERDRLEVPLSTAAMERDLPVFAICRGVQVLNVAAGGSLVQDIPSEIATDLNHAIDLPKNHHAHAVKVADITRIGAVIWVEREGQKGIVIGAGGAQLKKIGSSARRAMERVFDRRVFLELWVRVRESWSDDAAALKQFGYSE